MKRSRLFRFFWRFRLQLSVVFLSLATIVAFIPVFTYLYFVKDLSTKESIMNRNDTGLVLLDRKDRPFYTFYEAKYRKFIPLKDIPQDTQEAIIAVEDKEFYRHPGFSFRGIFRSLFLDIKEGEIAYGGSTITQQLVKNVLLNSKKSFLRKYQEIVLAQEIERRYSKREILEMYLNSVYFGEGAFGIEQAARTYFGKEATKLTLAESTLLAGILPAPSRYSPISGDKQAARIRQEYVLNEMLSQGYISMQEKRTAERKTLAYTTMDEDINSSGTHFALYVRDRLIDKYGEEQVSRSGFRVKTTLDLDWQKFAEKTVADQVLRLQANKVTNGASVVMDVHTGEVRVMVGSKNWFDEKFGKYNVATAKRSPGSAFKPIIYAAALEERLITPATPLQDRPTTFEGNYKPENYDRRFRGTVLVRRALANSLNVPSVEIMKRVGIEDGIEIGKRLGLTTLKNPSDYGLSFVLGTAEVRLLELTNVYATFANKGAKNDITVVSLITDKNGKEVFKASTKNEQVIEPAVAFLISSILSDNRARAEVFGNALTVNRPAAVKTGTGEDYKDALTMGYTPDVAVGVWVGNNDGSPMDKIAGSLGAAPIWRTLIEHISADTPITEFIPPSGITRRTVCSYNGLLVRGGNNTSASAEYFLAGTEPTRYCYIPKPTSSPQDPTGNIAHPPPGENKDEEQGKNKEKQDKDNGRGGPDVDLQKKIQDELEEKMKQQVNEMQQQFNTNPTP